MDEKLAEGLYCSLEALRISMGASLCSMKEGKGSALQGDARNVLSRLKSAIANLDERRDVSTEEALYLILEVGRITMGASLASMNDSPSGGGQALQGDAGALVNRLKAIRDYYSFG